MSERIIVQGFKKSIHESRYTVEQISIIWDFYVTHSFSESAGQKRIPSDYGLKQLPFNDMMKEAGVTVKSCIILPCDSINKTLLSHDLLITETTKDHNNKKNTVNRAIDISKPRIVCMGPYTIHDYENPKLKKSKAEILLTHIRNALAHGNTYFFENDMILLEDKNGMKVTAEIFLHMKTLLDWIKLIDRNEKYYKIYELNFTEKDNT